MTNVIEKKFNFTLHGSLCPEEKDSCWIQGWVGTTSGLYAMVHRKISTPATSQTQVI